MTKEIDIVAKFIPVTKPEAGIIRYLLLERIMVAMDVMAIAQSAIDGHISEDQRRKLPKELRNFTDEDLAGQYDHWKGMSQDLQSLADKFSPSNFE